MFGVLRSNREREDGQERRIVRRLLAWYDAYARRLPWRPPPRARKLPDPYPVWLSEVMLQQTTVKTVIPYYRNFLRRWPNVQKLADAPLDDVLTAWAGLGYYTRARNLHECARKVTHELGGRFPDTEEGLKALPGVGPYTAAAMAAIAFGRRAAAMDGNVERVMARLFAVSTPLPAARPELQALALRLVPEERPGDYTQALMDLGATICRPRGPLCLACPLINLCAARAQGIAGELPRRDRKTGKPVRHGAAFWLRRADGAVLLRRRPDEGLLGGMMEFPGTPWEEGDPPDAEEVRRHVPARARWAALPGEVRHSFTHFNLHLTVVTARLRVRANPEGVWAHPEEFDSYALPSVMKKVVRHALDAGA